jgi:hypothetical protein
VYEYRFKSDLVVTELSQADEPNWKELYQTPTIFSCTTFLIILQIFSPLSKTFQSHTNHIGTSRGESLGLGILMMMMMMRFIFVRGAVAESYRPRPPEGYGDVLS